MKIWPGLPLLLLLIIPAGCTDIFGSATPVITDELSAGHDQIPGIYYYYEYDNEAGDFVRGHDQDLPAVEIKRENNRYRVTFQNDGKTRYELDLRFYPLKNRDYYLLQMNCTGGTNCAEELEYPYFLFLVRPHADGLYFVDYIASDDDESTRSGRCDNYAKMTRRHNLAVETVELNFFGRTYILEDPALDQLRAFFDDLLTSPEAGRELVLLKRFPE